MGTVRFTEATTWRAVLRGALVGSIGALVSACDPGGGATVEPSAVESPVTGPPSGVPPRTDTLRTTQVEPSRAEAHDAPGEVPPEAGHPTAPAPPGRVAAPTRGPEPRLLLSKLHPSRAVTPGQLEQSVLRRRTVLLSCFSAAVAGNPTLRVDLDVQVSTEHTGRPRSTRVSSPSLADEELIACVRRALSAHVYPAARDAGPGRVSFRLTFDAAPE